MNKTKAISWFIFSIGLPLAVLVLVEVGLRLGGYGANLDDLFLTTPDGKYLYMNKDISRRYFTASQATTGNIEFFKKEKTPHTIRLFVLGESAAMGFPYPNNISFQRMLKQELQQANPQKQIEIINLSLTAINSYTFYDFAKELRAFQPDAILIYGGHNEYYGALGVASTNTFGNRSSLVRLTILLRQTKLVQGLEELGNLLRSSQKEEGSDNLMKYVVGNQLIAYQSGEYNQGIEQFDRNMTDVLELFAAEPAIPVYLSTVATNLKDQYPFRSLLAEQTDSAAFYTELHAATTKLHAGEVVAADSILNTLYKTDASNADCAYLWGQVRLAQGDSAGALARFDEAKQKDGLRFRAPNEINEKIRQLSTRFENVRLVEAEEAFKQAAPQGIPGYGHLLEHVHPNIEGHKLIARCFLGKMAESGLFRTKDMADYALSDSSLNSFPVLQFDSLVGVYACARLKQGFPFYEQGGDTLRVESPVEKLAMQYAREKNWYKSMETLYKQAILLKDYELALEVMRVRILDNPYDASFYSAAGDLCVALGREAEALNYYTKGYMQ